VKVDTSTSTLTKKHLNIMSTGNFYYGNARHIYAFGENRYYTEEDVRENGMDESLVGEYDEWGTQMDFENSIDYMCELLDEKGYYETEGSDNRRNYELQYKMAKVETISLHGVEYRVTIKAGYRCGYYEGANFDYDLEIEEYCNDYYNACYDEIPTLSDIGSAFECRNARQRKDTEMREFMFAKMLEKELENVIDMLVDEVEEVFSNVCQYKLCVTARFSNGETWYGKVE